MSQITLSVTNHSFHCDTQHTILEAALAANLVLPHSCRNGKCGSCKSKILEGTVDYGDHQPETLTEEEKLQGYALLCRAKPTCDEVVIQITQPIQSASDKPIRKLAAIVDALEKPASDVAIVHLKLPNNQKLDFWPGQYIDILLKDGHRRSFSLANTPKKGDKLELHIRHIAGGLFTDPLFTTFKGKEILRFEGPLGTFKFNENSDKPIICIAGGTGFAPLQSMIEDSIDNGWTRPIIFYWGARTRKDLYKQDIPSLWEQTHSHIMFVPVLSDPQPEDNWAGKTGFVHEAVLQDFKSLSNFEVYACGSPQMVAAARRDFIAQAELSSDAFFADAFELAAPAENTAPAPSTTISMTLNT
ncbi:MAG: CDP-6-deoxy-delta-3,4-glucoseen reductase [Pseudomonadota bacterium]